MPKAGLWLGIDFITFFDRLVKFSDTEWYGATLSDHRVSQDSAQSLK
jgi:hypothetical protein